jgi:hypothetical protein
MPEKKNVPSSENKDGAPSGTGNKKSSHRLLKTIAFVVTPALAAVIGDYAVHGTHSVAAKTVCAVKYLAAPSISYPGSSQWTAYGVTSLTTTSGRSFSIEPAGQLLTDEWFGASMNGPGLCDYRIDFDADISEPLDQPEATALGYGYAVGADGAVVNDVPYGTTVQFDPPFQGLRTVELPGGANAIGHNARKYSFINTNHDHHWVLTITGSKMAVCVDGQQYGPVSLSQPDSGSIIFRVWNARLGVSNVRISKLRP